VTTRQEIADALSNSGIDTVVGFEKRPTTFSKGMAWGQVASRDRADGFFATTWAIYVILAADQNSATDWYLANIQALRDALQAVVYIDRDEPVLVAAGTDQIPAILITARSE
jgi:hypothetical protein